MGKTINLEDDVMSFFYQNRKSFGDTDEPDSKRERLKKIMRTGIVQELTDKQRDCMLKRYVNGMSVKDIAETMNISASNVYKHISKAKKRIARLYNYL